MLNIKKLLDKIDKGEDKQASYIWEGFLTIKDNFPEKIAIINSTKSIKYQELYNKAEKLSNYMRNKKVQKVALLFDHSFEMIIAMLAALKNYTTYIPLDPNLPIKRLIDIVIDGKADLILTDIHNSAKSNLINKETNVKNIIYNDELTNRRINKSENLLPQNKFSPAYILYTSGSTGIPKGVIQTQDNILRHIYNYTKALNITKEDNLSLFSTYAFDASVMDIYSALLNAATLCIVNVKNESLHSILNFLQKSHLTILHLVPTLFRHIMEPVKKKNFFPDLRYIVLGGEAVTKKDIAVFNKKFDKDVYLVNGYGPTECTVALQYFIRNRTMIKNDLVPIGRPVEGISFFLQKKEENEEVGEIVLIGKGVAYGYWNNSCLTDQSFKISYDTGINAFFTGDYGYIDENCNLVYVGRQDGQLKVNGQKVYLVEIESFLKSLHEINNAVAVQIIKDGKSSIVVFVSGQHLNINKIRESLLNNMPAYMQPSDIVILDKLPLTISRKVDRYLLKKEYNPAFKQEIYIPKNNLEKEIIGIYQDVLKCKIDTISKSITEIGGDSISALRIFMRLQQAFETDIKLSKFNVNSTIQDVIQYITNNKLIKKEETFSLKKFYKLSQAQLRHWYRIKNGLPNTALNVAYIVTIEGNLNLRKFNYAINTVIRRHSAFSTAFFEQDGIPYQFNKSEPKFLHKLLEIQQLDAESQKKILEEHKAEVLNYFFDLSKGNLFHIRLIKVSKTRYIMLYVIHHIITDGWSNKIFQEELWQIYSLPFNQVKQLFPIQPRTYAEYVYVEQQNLKNDFDQLKKINFWQKLLKGTLSPIDNYNIVPNLDPKRKFFTFKLNSKATSNIQKFSIGNNTSLFIICLSIFKFTLFKTTGEINLITTTDTAGRDNYRFENTIGFFTNILPIPITLQRNNSLKDNIFNICETYDRCLQNEIPFTTLINELLPNSLGYYNTIFPNVFVFQNADTNIKQINGLTVTWGGIPNVVISLDIIFEVVKEQNEILVNIIYKPSKYKPEVIEKMSQIYQELAKQLCEVELQKLSDI